MSGGGRLEVRGVVQKFGALTALDGVDLTVQAGERHGLIGPNGSGKSTLLGVLAGALRPNDGVVQLSGTDISRWPVARRVRAGITLKFQMPRVFNDLSVEQNLRVASRFQHGAITDHADDGADDLARMLDVSGLLAVQSAKASGLSHGYRQWLELAMALCTRPRILLLDEPTAGMSPSERTRTAELIKSTSCTLVIVDHDIPFIAALCSSLTLLHSGKVYASGETQDVLNQPIVSRLFTGGAPDA
jgi:branched-chain amino acid transport system ATP-binding protein